MKSHPNHYSAAYLQRLLAEGVFATQRELAQVVGTNTTGVSRHLTGERVITPEACAAYLRAVPSPHRRPFLRAWLRDQIDPEIDSVLEATENSRTAEPVSYQNTAHPTLLAWLQREIQDDPEFETALKHFSRRMGWTGEKP